MSDAKDINLPILYLGKKCKMFPKETEIKLEVLLSLSERKNILFFINFPNKFIVDHCEAFKFQNKILF